MGNGTTHTGAIGVGDIDPWTFTATQGDAIALSIGKVVPSATLWPWIRLVSPSGVTVGQGFGLAAAQIVDRNFGAVTAPETGTYTVIVGSWDGSASSTSYAGTGTYVLSLVKAPGSIVISAGDEGGPMGNGTTHTGAIGVGDIDPWTFTATQGDAIALSIGKVVPTATLWPWIRLVSPSGVTVGQGFGLNAAHITVTATATGTYTVIVGSWDGSAGSTSYAGSGSYTLIRQ